MIRDAASEALAQAEFFDICDEEQRRMLAFAGDVRRFDADSVLYQSGDTPMGAFVLLEGTLQAKPDGTAKPYEISERGSVISTMALIIAKPRPVTFSAVTDCETLFVPRHAFLKLVHQSPDLAQRATARIQQDLGRYVEALQPVRKRMRGE